MRRSLRTGAILMEGLAPPRTSSFPGPRGWGYSNNPPARTVTCSADGRSSLSSRTVVRTTPSVSLAPVPPRLYSIDLPLGSMGPDELFGV
mmetsp:Transcript_15596/g.35132  ORF Transcript_15596/g.35132 Transcript_15596/m.35132 type:complete len:90 (-) Transcript_15596:68-337(-)